MLRRRKFFQGRRIRGADVQDIAWLDPSGREMRDEAWNSPDVRCLGVRLNGDAIDEVDERGERIVGDTLLMLLNAGDDVVPFVLPADRARGAVGNAARHGRSLAAVARLRGGDRYQLQARSMAVLRLNCRKEDLSAIGGLGTDGGLLTPACRVRLHAAPGT